MVTSDLNKFGRREKDMMIDLFVLYRDNKITKIAKDYFDFGTMKPAYNINSGYVFLTDDDYNMMVGALQNMQGYILRFMYTDITNKATAMDTELNKVIDDVNRFMADLEITYSKSPSEYPIPDNSVLRPKLEEGVQETLNYTDGIQGVVFGASKPANPQGRSFVWFNTGDRIE